MPFPPAHILVGAGSAELVRAATPVPRWLAYGVAAVFALLPDIDIALRILIGDQGLADRSFTHSLLATAIVTVLVWIVAGGRWAAVAGAAYASHLVADLLQAQEMTSVVLFWPLQMEPAEPVARLFPSVEFERGQGVRGAARSVFRRENLEHLFLQTAIAALMYLAALLVSWSLRRLRGTKPRPE